jgi:hypothetical protein
VFCCFQHLQEFKVRLEEAMIGMEDACAKLKKLASYVSADMFIDEIVWRMLDIEGKLQTNLGRSWYFLCGADEQDMVELEQEAYEDYIREPGMDGAEWTAKNNVDWDEVEDRRMN